MLRKLPRQCDSSKAAFLAISQASADVQSPGESCGRSPATVSMPVVPPAQPKQALIDSVYFLRKIF